MRTSLSDFLLLNDLKEHGQEIQHAKRDHRHEEISARDADSIPRDEES